MSWLIDKFDWFFYRSLDWLLDCRPPGDLLPARLVAAVPPPTPRPAAHPRAPWTAGPPSSSAPPPPAPPALLPAPPTPTAAPLPRLDSPPTSRPSYVRRTRRGANDQFRCQFRAIPPRTPVPRPPATPRGRRPRADAPRRNTKRLRWQGNARPAWRPRNHRSRSRCVTPLPRHRRQRSRPLPRRLAARCGIRRLWLAISRRSCVPWARSSAPCRVWSRSPPRTPRPSWPRSRVKAAGAWGWGSATWRAGQRRSRSCVCTAPPPYWPWDCTGTSPSWAVKASSWHPPPLRLSRNRRSSGGIRPVVPRPYANKTALRCRRHRPCRPSRAPQPNCPITVSWTATRKWSPCGACSRSAPPRRLPLTCSSSARCRRRGPRWTAVAGPRWWIRVRRKGRSRDARNARGYFTVRSTLMNSKWNSQHRRTSTCRSCFHFA